MAGDRSQTLSGPTDRRPALWMLWTALVLGATLGWVANGHVASGAESRVPLLTDAISSVARERDRAVVVLHVLEHVPRPVLAISRDWVQQPIRETLGSGVVIDDAGLILTNEHVIRSGSVVHVRRSDGADVPASILGSDPDTDLALLRVSDTTGLASAPLGDSDALEVGSFVIAIGSPLGLHHTVTSGVLSAKSRALDESGAEFLQTDAAINPGSSGGPLFDLNGAVVGITTTLLSENGQNVGLNFAVPINTARDLLPDLLRNRVTHAWLGVSTSALSATGAAALHLPSPEDGLLVSSVQRDGPAERAGVMPRDVLLGMTSTRQIQAAEVFRRVRTLEPGTPVHLRILRDGAVRDIQVILGTKPVRANTR